MKKVLIGICGIGNGHINRQISVIKELQDKKKEVVVAVTENKVKLLKETFPKLKIICIHIPWITCHENGIDFKDCLEKYDTSKIDYFKEFLTFSKQVEMAFNAKPDLIISDYEPNVAQYAYANNKPLLCMEQQAKFLYIKEREIPAYSIQEEIYRLNYFFPKVDYRLISSFFYLPIKQKNVKMMPPIIKNIEKQEKIKQKGLIYLSPYCHEKEQFLNILNLASKLKEFTFTIYTDLEFFEYKAYAHMKFKPFGKTFTKDLASASFLITSSGHQLISEAIANEIPLYLFPLNTYEQNYNCLMVVKNNFGKKIEEANISEFYQFYENIPFYKKKMKKYKNKYWKKSWKEILWNTIDQLETKQTKTKEKLHK